MTTYKAEIGHILGSLGNVIHHAANILTITAQHLTGDTEEEPQPQVDVFTQAEHAGQRSANELHADADRQSHDDDDGGSYRLGFNNDHLTGGTHAATGK